MLKPAQAAKSGYRYYSQEQLQDFSGLKNPAETAEKKVIGYCRGVLPNRKITLNGSSAISDGRIEREKIYDNDKKEIKQKNKKIFSTPLF